MNKDATFSCFLRCSNNQAQRLAGRDFIAIMAPSTIFLLWMWLTKVKLLFEDLIQCSCQQQRLEFGQNAGPSQTSMREGKMEKRETDWEKLREREKEEGRGQGGKKKICITNDKSKLKVCLAGCHSLPFIFRKQTVVIIDLMVQLEWKHFWA